MKYLFYNFLGSFIAFLSLNACVLDGRRDFENNYFENRRIVFFPLENSKDFKQVFLIGDRWIWSNAFLFDREDPEAWDRFFTNVNKDKDARFYGMKEGSSKALKFKKDVLKNNRVALDEFVAYGSYRPKAGFQALFQRNGNFIYADNLNEKLLFSCTFAPLNCKITEPEKGHKKTLVRKLSDQKEKLQLFKNFLDKKKYSAFCKDVFEKKDPLFEKYNEIIKREGFKLHSERIEDFCDSILALIKSVKSHL